MSSSDHPALYKGILLSPISCKAAALLHSPSFSEGLRNLGHDCPVTKHLNSPGSVSVSSYPRKDLGPSLPLCVLFFPLTFPILVLEGIKVTWKGHNLPPTGHFGNGITGVQSVPPMVHTLPPPSSMGCREFAPGLRWRQELPHWLCGSFKVASR